MAQRTLNGRFRAPLTAWTAEPVRLQRQAGGRVPAAGPGVVRNPEPDDRPDQERRRPGRDLRPGQGRLRRRRRGRRAGPAGGRSCPAGTRRTDRARRGEEAWLREIGRLAGDAARPAAPPRRRTLPPPHASAKARSYNTADVDDLCRELIGYLEDDQPLSVDNVRRAVFRARRGPRRLRGKPGGRLPGPRRRADGRHRLVPRGRATARAAVNSSGRPSRCGDRSRSSVRSGVCSRAISRATVARHCGVAVARDTRMTTGRPPGPSTRPAAPATAGVPGPAQPQWPPAWNRRTARLRSPCLRWRPHVSQPAPPDAQQQHRADGRGREGKHQRPRCRPAPSDSVHRSRCPAARRPTAPRPAGNPGRCRGARPG